ncbi:MAG TPA: class I mannose-6-phosphate isomerase [Roseiflexaceae bacterium]|nr:class I mannose-6-phosphate isomerase [Roseiflexaceae bacterium]
MTYLPPLALERHLDSRLWGGSTLGPWLGLTDSPPQLAESWQVYERNRIAGGPFAGRTLADLTSEYGAALVGEISFARYGADFPLLAKFIDAADHLSIQVHPDDIYAHRVEAATGFHGKTEAWYILQTTPGASLYHGLKRDTNRAEFASAIANGSILSLLRSVAVKPGDTLFVPAGTVHAINAGIMLFEIQQKSDLTYRVYDYDRRDTQGNLRELHLERALDVIDYRGNQPPLPLPQELGVGRTLLTSCTYFAMERWRIETDTAATTTPSSFVILTAIDGAARLVSAAGSMSLALGDSLVLPASLGAYRIIPSPAITLLACYVPAQMES